MSAIGRSWSSVSGSIIDNTPVDSHMNVKGLIERLAWTPGETAYVVFAWILLLIAFHGIFGAFFPMPNGSIGHDYGLALGALIDGFIWFEKNGPWAVPWFTPGFCGGQPFFADPQSGYYSVPQWLTFVTDPLTASYLTLLIFVSVGYFGIYLLARRSFELPVAWAIFAAALYFFNGFLPHRMIVGHLGYHGLMLAPWLALALLTPAASRVSSMGLAILAGLIAAYWLQSGLTTLMVPAALSVALILLLYRLRQPWPRDLPVRMLIAIGVSVALSASKLMASLSFYSLFERTQYLLPGFDNPVALLAGNLLALFGFSQAAYYVWAHWQVNAQWALLPHEWAYSFTVVPILAWTRARALARRKADGSSPSAEAIDSERPYRIGTGAKILVGLAITLVVLIPLAYQFYTPELNALYKRLPLIGATVAPVRWLIVYLPVIPIATALIAFHTLAHRQNRATVLVAGLIALLIAFNWIEPRNYYKEQDYNPDKLLAGYQRLSADSTAIDHRVQAIGFMTNPLTGEPITDGGRNDIVVDGISQAHCYNPSFGYRLEKLPPADIQPGDVLAERDGYLNIRNPACYVFPTQKTTAGQGSDSVLISAQKQRLSLPMYPMLSIRVLVKNSLT
jgi:hypothetical protein